MTREYEKALWLDRLESLRAKVGDKSEQDWGYKPPKEFWEMRRIEAIVMAIDFESALVAFKRRAAHGIAQAMSVS